MLNQLLILISGLLAAIGFGYLKGKKSVEAKENETAVKKIQKLNDIKDEISKLSDTALDEQLSKFQRPKQ